MKDSKSLLRNKDGVIVPIDKLQSCNVVGLYFSGHWTDLHGGEPWCGFTPKLAKVYNKCKEEGKKLEIVFISWDDNEMEFSDYFGNMPWPALSYVERRLKSSLSDIFNVQFIPTPVSYTHLTLPTILLV